MEEPRFRVSPEVADALAGRRAVVALADAERRIYGIQFHPEVVHTESGGRILQNFVRDICGCAPNWTMDAFIDDTVKAIREHKDCSRAERAVGEVNAGIYIVDAAFLRRSKNQTSRPAPSSTSMVTGNVGTTMPSTAKLSGKPQ